VSGDGRFVVFESDADNLVPGDTNGRVDVFLRDLRRGTVERVSVRDDGGEYTVAAHAPQISADGRYVTFAAGTGTVEEGTYYSGRFLRDRVKDRTEVVSRTDDDRPVAGAYGHAGVSRDGRYVAFVSDLADHGDERTDALWAGLYLRDRKEGSTRLVSLTTAPSPGGGTWSFADFTMSADGSRVAYRVLRNRPGTGSAVYLHDRTSGRTERFDPRGQGSSLPTFSGDGRYAAFASAGSGLVPGDTNGKDDVFVRDLRTGATERVSLTAAGGQTDGDSGQPVISEDGRHVVFRSEASGLVAGETARGPLFARDLRTGVTRRVAVAHDGGESDSQSWSDVAVSRDGRVVAFESWATNLVPDDTNELRDIFVRRLR
jgi:Tol biopolymer transport system component